MAGGKETPRQKMIGMMYLVLTALLALNVSKAILDAFVAIEENIQISNLNEFGRGQEKKTDLQNAANDASVPETQKKARELLKVVKDIDKMTEEQIRMIDRLKLEILEKCGENTIQVGNEFILQSKFDASEPLKPIRMNLAKVDGKDKYDEPMDVMGIADDITKPKGDGIKLWNSYNNYRAELTELIAKSSSDSEHKFSFKDPKINSFKDFSDIKKQLKSSLKNVSPDDKEALIKIYSSLSKQEFADMNEGEIKHVHWIGRTFDHSPSVAALASLSSLQKEILTARADAVSLLSSRVGTGEFAFNKIMPLAYGPEVANQNEEVEVQVLMAAFNSDRKPQVTVFSGGTLDRISDGKGYVKTKGSSGEVKLTGEITILNKSGVPKTMPWEKTIQIMKPQATVTLPEMNVLYRGYDNKIQAVASGYPETKVSGTNVSLKKTPEGYVGTVTGSAKTASISVSGFNKATGKSVPLGTTTFRVRNMPKPNVYFGGYEEGQVISPAENKVKVGYGSDIPLNATFRVLTWEVIVSGAPFSAKGTGGQLDAKATSLLRQGKKGSTVTIQVSAVGPDNIRRNLSASFKL